MEIKKVIQKNKRPEGILKIILYILLSSSGLFLLVNRYPYLAIASMVIMLISGLIFLFIKGNITSYHSELLGVLSLLFAYLVLSYFNSGQLLVNFLSYRFLRYDGNFFFAYLPFFLLAIPYFDYKKVTKIYIGFLFSTFGIFSLIGIYGFLSGNTILSMFKDTRDRGIMFMALNQAHNATGSIIAIVCIILLSFFLKESKKKIKYTYLFLLIICLAALFVTKSRGSYIGFIIGAVAVLWFYFRSWKKFGITIASFILVSIPAFYFSGIYNRLPDFFDFSGGTSAVRVRLWEQALYLFGQSPIFGVGFARYNDVGYDNIRLSGIRGLAAMFIEPNFDYSSGHAHNSYLQFLSETGIIGLGLLMLFWIVCFAKNKKAYDFTNDSFSQKIFLSNLGIIVALFALSLTENYFSATTVMMNISVMISLSMGLLWQENKDKNTEPG